MNTVINFLLELPVGVFKTTIFFFLIFNTRKVTVQKYTQR